MSLRPFHFTVLLVLGVFLVAVPNALGQFTDGLNVEYGKNRVQYRGFEWQYFEQGMFEVYHYRGGDQAAGQVARVLDTEAKDLAPLFGRAMEGPIQVLVFNSQEEFRQSNVGIMLAQDEATNIGGAARLVGSKMFVYATGDRQRLLEDVREGLARILFNQAMYEAQWSDALRSGNLVQVPEWMSEGLARYASRRLDPESQGRILDACQTGAFERIDQTSGADAALLGQAMWAYVADIYGVPTVANVLYMTRITRSVENGFRLATGFMLSDLAMEAKGYHLRQAGPSYADRFPSFVRPKELRKARRMLGEDIPMRANPRLHCQQFLPSPDGTQMAFTTNERGQWRVGTLDLRTGKRTWHAVLGHRLDRLNDDLAPRLAWHPKGKTLAFALELEGAPRLGLVNMATQNVDLREIFKIDQILDMAYSPDGRILLMSALQDGHSDLYRYDVLANNHRPLWRDRFDDLQPAFWPGSTQFMFASNRPDDTLRKDLLDHPFPPNLDLYVGDLADDPIELTRWTHTPDVDERHPHPLDRQEFLMVQRKEGDNEDGLGFGWRDSIIVAVDTIVRYRNFTQLRSATAMPQGAIAAFLGRDTSRFMLPRAGIHHWVAMPMPDLSALHSQEPEVPMAVSDDLPYPTQLPEWNRPFAPDEINFRDYVFEGEELATAVPTEQPGTKDGPSQEEPTYARLVPRNYRLNFALDKLQTALNNTFGTNFYQPYNSQVNAQPGLGNATEIRISDVMDDKHFIGGYTIPANLSNTFFGLAYLNLEGQLDKELSFQRQSSVRIDPGTGQLVETANHLLRREWRWALDEVRSIRWGVAFRFSQDAVQGTDLLSLSEPNSTGEQLGLQVAFVHDDTRSPRLNIRHGLRARFWAEYFVDGVATSTAQQPGDGLQVPDNGWSFGTVGFDVRRYFPLVGPSILALRTAADWSIGQKRLLHMLGGTDNSLSINGNANTPVDPDIPFAYQARISPLRGFQNNVRNGSHVAVANAEIRLPIFFNSTGKTDFLKHLQAIGFADVGAAWTGLHPYTDDNSFNFVTVEANPITVTVSNNREPILYDLGFGLRSRVLGYWLAADWAYGVDDGITLPRRFTLSLNFDF